MKKENKRKKSKEKFSWLDEERIYKPICFILLLSDLVLLLLNIINPVQFLISFATLTYTLFVFFPFHRKAFTPLSIIIASAIAGSLGIASFIRKEVLFQQVSLVFYILASLIFASLFFGLFIYKKGGIGIDITLNYISKKFGMKAVYLFALILIPASLFVVYGTYSLLGKEHIFFWTVVFIFGSVSSLRTIKETILAYMK